MAQANVYSKVRYINVAKSYLSKDVTKKLILQECGKSLCVHLCRKRLCVPECDGLLVLVVPRAPQLPGLVPDLLHLGIVLHHNGVLKEGAGAGVRAVAVQTVLCNIIQLLSLCNKRFHHLFLLINQLIKFLNQFN